MHRRTCRLPKRKKKVFKKVDAKSLDSAAPSSAILGVVPGRFRGRNRYLETSAGFSSTCSGFVVLYSLFWLSSLASLSFTISQNFRDPCNGTRSRSS